MEPEGKTLREFARDLCEHPFLGFVFRFFVWWLGEDFLLNNVYRSMQGLESRGLAHQVNGRWVLQRREP